MPKVSVIVAVYKVEDFLRPCLDSIINQTFQDFELILIDDGSPDGCGAICDEYARRDSRIKVFHQENKGISAVRNAGIKAAEGEYLLFVDSDDTIEPELLSDAVDCVNELSADMVIFHYRAIDPEGKLIYLAQIDLPAKTPFTINDNKELLLAPNCPWNKLIRKDLYADMSFPIGAWYEDLWVYPRLYLRAKKVVYIGGKPLYNYLIHPGSIMKSGNFDKLYHDRTLALKELLSYFRQKGFFAQYSEELEALTTLHGFFYASMEILLLDKNREKLAKLRAFIESEFPDFKHNRYIKKLSTKQHLQFLLLCHKQYVFIRLLTCLKNLKNKLKK